MKKYGHSLSQMIASLTSVGDAGRSSDFGLADIMLLLHLLIELLPRLLLVSFRY